MTSISVPQDIIETIIDEFQDDTKALQACALVSSAFCARSQNHIYSRMKLNIYEGARIIQLSNTLSIHPHIALYVRHLTIVMDGYNYPESFLGIIRMFTHIQSLKFGLASEEWDRFPGELTSAILDLLSFPRLRDLSISDLDNFPYLNAFRRCSRLEVLKLDDVYPPDTDEDTDTETSAGHSTDHTSDDQSNDPIPIHHGSGNCTDNDVNASIDGQFDSAKLAPVDSAVQHAKLDNLVIVISGDTSLGCQLLQSLIAPDALPGLPSLRRFSIETLGRIDQTDAVQDLLDITANSLQELSLSVNAPYGGLMPMPPPLNLGPLSLLSTLSIRTSSDISMSFPWCQQLLSSVPLMNNIETITMKFTPSEVDLHEVSWRVIDATVTSWKSARLRVFALKFLYVEENPNFAVFFDEQMPGIFRKGLLSVFVIRASPVTHRFEEVQQL